jgi:uncharacterized repeat protein (TIGR03803 family)
MGASMSSRLRQANSNSGKLLRGPANALLLVLALGTAAALRAQQPADKSLAGTYSLLYSFQCSPDGDYPDAGLVRDSSGNLYGITYNGGQYDFGAVFKLTPGGTETVLHSFAGPPSDGGFPEYGSLTLDSLGNIYGTTDFGGEFGSGTVYKVTATGTESLLYSFCAQSGCMDGYSPFGGVVRDSSGNLYGTTYYGGTYDRGVVFKLTPSGTESVLHIFGSSPNDGANPTADLIRDSSGNLYGTTSVGGASNAGMVFEVTASGAESVFFSFDFSDGANPFGGGLLRDTAGNLYGVTRAGGAGGGVVFELTPEGTESMLLNLGVDGARGESPYDGLARDAAGTLYGATYGGGFGAGCPIDHGCGVLFALTTAGREVVLHGFTLSTSSGGGSPFGGVVRDPSGNLYGTLSKGGAYGCGAVFKFTP